MRPKRIPDDRFVVLKTDDKNTVGRLVGVKAYYGVDFDGKQRTTFHEPESLRAATPEELAAYHAGKIENRVAAIVERLPVLSMDKIAQIEKIVRGE